MDFLLRAHRDKAAARRYFEKAVDQIGEPETVTIDKSGANMAALEALNAERQTPIKIRQSKYLNNVVEQDHRAINIGPVAEALLDALAAGARGDFAIACPAFPENGRTVYRGHLFVSDTLLRESGMENHPLTPMGDPNLVRVPQRQSKSTVGLLRARRSRRARTRYAKRSRVCGRTACRLAIADALTDAELRTLGEACAGLRSSRAVRLSPSACRRTSAARDSSSRTSRRRICRPSQARRSCWRAVRRRRPTHRSPNGSPRARRFAPIRARWRVAKPSSKQRSRSSIPMRKSRS